jgi:hypothetical protein
VTLPLRRTASAGIVTVRLGPASRLGAELAWSAVLTTTVMVRVVESWESLAVRARTYDPGTLGNVAFVATCFAVAKTTPEGPLATLHVMSRAPPGGMVESDTVAVSWAVRVGRISSNPSGMMMAGGEFTGAGGLTNTAVSDQLTNWESLADNLST